MRSFYLFLLSSLFISFQSVASIYLDNNWHPTERSESAKFYLEKPLIQDDSQALWPVKLFYLNGELRFEGQITFPSLTDAKKVGAFKFYHPNGQVEQEGKFNEHGQFDGDINCYDPQGNLIQTDHYINGQLSGMSKRYYANGKLKETFANFEGKRHGPDIFYTSNGELLRQKHFEYGQLDGSQFEYYPNGQTKSRTNVIAGVRDGARHVWAENGVLTSVVYFKNGRKQGQLREYTDTGILIKELNYNDGQLVGLQRYYFPDGRVKYQRHFQSPNKLTREIQYNQRGQLISEIKISYQGEDTTTVKSIYRDEKLVSHYFLDTKQQHEIIERYNDNQQMIHRREYKHQLKFGRWIKLHQNNIRYPSYLEKTYYIDDDKNGLFVQETLAGELLVKGRYKNDKRLGDWHLYTPNGELIAKYVYNKSGELDKHKTHIFDPEKEDDLLLFYGEQALQSRCYYSLEHEKHDDSLNGSNQVRGV